MDSKRDSIIMLKSAMRRLYIDRLDDDENVETLSHGNEEYAADANGERSALLSSWCSVSRMQFSD